MTGGSDERGERPQAFHGFDDFTGAARGALELLQGELGMGLWAFTRTTDDDWIILAASNKDVRYTVEEGDVLRWSDSFCSRMVRGEGPSFAPRSSEVPAYADAPIGKALPIGAYIGIPLINGEGDLFGTLCAIDPDPQVDISESAALMLQTVGDLLVTLLDRELRLAQVSRRLEVVEHMAMRDELTNLWNRRGWEELCRAEEGRCRRYGHPAGILSIDLDGLKAVNDTHGHSAGDELLRRFAAVVRGSVREQDIVGRVGGDEFLVLLVESSEAQSRTVEARIVAALDDAGIAASVGRSQRHPREGLDAARKAADAAMYEEKRRRRQERA